MVYGVICRGVWCDMSGYTYSVHGVICRGMYTYIVWYDFVKGIRIVYDMICRGYTYSVWYDMSGVYV